LPAKAGSVALQNKNARSSDLWVMPTGWTSDRKRYRYTAATKKFTSEPLSSEARYPEFADLVVEEQLVPSHDGVLVPLRSFTKKARRATVPPRCSSTATVPILFPTRRFSTPTACCGRNRAVCWPWPTCAAVASKAGQKATKPNTWKDLIACADYLVKGQYTAPGHIAINGGSAGGILIGRAMTERPDLFAAAIPQVGCLNAVRMENSPNGPVNAPEFGTVLKEDECKALLEMDAYQHLQPGTKYPATLVTAGMNDPRVIAWQPAKFAARLQASTASGKPVLLFTDYDAGHGIGNSKQKQFESVADVLSFGLWQTGAPGFQPKPIATSLK